MPTEQESLWIKKDMAYDLIALFRANDKTYTSEEVELIIRQYILDCSDK